ncbi:uncharacterized protein LOC131333953 [Rhododendron vialii]|uniref:uncharacterized protein LOC131333953 n=1 Tax=Rhododendron vialii TaxID=182163 RepID=UPI00265DF1A9|nr:uncharacterized protein LOC131333953 [Rhododendron vialii]
MIGLGCTVDGYLNDSKFDQPVPWIGIYIAVASAACAIAMAVDAFNGFRQRKFWFPCKFFSLNATTLTFIAVAIKLSVDLNTSMPRRQEQLAKLSSAALICTVMGNSMPSLGTMGNKEIVANIVALGILVITAIVNICIQLGTGVIYVFWKEHAFLMFLMLVLLAMLCSSALTVPTTKRYFEMKYTKKHQMAMKECSNGTEKCHPEKLREDLTKFWMMAHTCGPQFVIGRSATCTASGAFSLLAAVTLAEAMLRSYFMPRSFKFCIGESAYKWSTTLVLVTQIIAVVAGTIAPAFRWFTAINFRCPKKATKVCKFKPQFKVENYWIQWMVEWKECPLGLPMWGRQGKKLTHDAKNATLDLCIRVQCGIVVVSKLVRLVSIFFMRGVLTCYLYCKGLTWLFKCHNGVTNDDSGSESKPFSKLHLSRFVLHLEGEEELIDVMVESNCDATDKWFLMGKKKPPKNLIQLLEKSKSLKEFKGVLEFDSDKVPSLDAEEPTNCWALPVVTLTSIAVALPGIDSLLIEQLIRSVNEGLMYVRIVQNNLNSTAELDNIRRAAEILWLGIELYHRWLDVDLRKMALQAKSPEKVMEELSDNAQKRFWEFRTEDIHGCLREDPSRWPVKVLASNSMYRICKTIFMDYEARDYDGSERLFERLCTMIADIFGACFTNLPMVIPMQCHNSAIEEREESVHSAIVLLGKSEKILEILSQQPLSSLNPEQLAHIDDWRSLHKQKTLSTVGSATAFSSSDLYVSIV